MKWLNDYKALKHPEGFCDGLIFSWAKGRQLDIYGERCNLKRRKLWLFKEPDLLYKTRLRNEGIRELYREGKVKE